MKIMFVVGGSYKGFYLNKVNEINNIDLLIFNQNIFYDFDCDEEFDFGGLITNELINLNKKINCPIIVYGWLINRGIRSKCFILCNNQKIDVVDANKDIYLNIKGRFILLGNRQYLYSKTFATISMLDEQNLNKIDKMYINNYFICDKKSVTYLNRNKSYRKFQKCCEFILKKNK